jgi:uncharacterized protein YcfL
MVLKKICLSFATATALVACSSNHNNSVNAQTTSDGKHFGATINADHAIGL